MGEKKAAAEKHMLVARISDEMKREFAVALAYHNLTYTDWVRQQITSWLTTHGVKVHPTTRT